MERIPVASSNLVSAGFDPETGLLEVEFASGGVYVYHGVSQGEYDDLLSAPSAGRYLHTVIKPNHSYAKV